MKLRELPCVGAKLTELSPRAVRNLRNVITSSVLRRLMKKSRYIVVH